MFGGHMAARHLSYSFRIISSNCLCQPLPSWTSQPLLLWFVEDFNVWVWKRYSFLVYPPVHEHSQGTVNGHTLKETRQGCVTVDPFPGSWRETGKKRSQIGFVLLIRAEMPTVCSQSGLWPPRKLCQWLSGEAIMSL